METGERRKGKSYGPINFSIRKNLRGLDLLEAGLVLLLNLLLLIDLVLLLHLLLLLKLLVLLELLLL